MGAGSGLGAGATMGAGGGGGGGAEEHAARSSGSAASPTKVAKENRFMLMLHQKCNRRLRAFYVRYKGRVRQ
jgi:hypothetical protein